MKLVTAVPSVDLDSRPDGGSDGSVSAPSPVAVRSPYERRVDLVVDVLSRNSKTSAADATRLAVLVLHAIDHVPENVR